MIKDSQRDIGLAAENLVRAILVGKKLKQRITGAK